MKSVKRLSGILLVVALVAFNSVPVHAGWVGKTYFEGAVAGGPIATWPPCWTGDPYCLNPSADGLYSINGSVMPNPYPGTTQTNGAGAIGEKALGLNPGDNNQTRKQKLFTFLKNKNASGSDWEKMGSALIVHQMLGRSWGTGGRSIPSTDFDELYKRLVLNTDLVMSRQYHAATDNTSGTLIYNNGWGNDPVFDAAKWSYSSHADQDSWVFYNSGAEVYAIEIICANPLGSLSGLPPYNPLPEDYVLNPSVSSGGVVSVEPGGDITIDGMVENTAANPSKGTEWRLTRVVYGPGTNPSTAGNDSTAQPCDFFDAAGRIPPPCATVDSGTGRIFSANATAVVKDNYVYSVPLNAEFGTRICFAVSVKPPTEKSEDQDKWRHSNLLCIMISKSPKMQVWGGDVRVKGLINTSTRNYTGPNRTYGSWGEYGALSNGGNSGFASGSSLNTGNASSDPSSWDALTFANTGSAGVCRFGCYNFLLASQGLVDQFVVASPTPLSTTNLNDLGSGTYGIGNLTLVGTTIDSGKSIVILSTGTVTIAGNIAYSDGPYSSVDQIPQVVIKAPRINIGSGVSQVDAWLFATTGSSTGVLDTCSDRLVVNGVTTDSLTSNFCNNPLTINGPVVADKIHLRRTAGSGSQPDERDDPAEIFNLRADAYLWGSGRGAGANKARTVYTRELPPRF